MILCLLAQAPARAAIQPPYLHRRRRWELPHTSTWTGSINGPLVQPGWPGDRLVWVLKRGGDAILGHLAPNPVEEIDMQVKDADGTGRRGPAARIASLARCMVTLTRMPGSWCGARTHPSPAGSHVQAWPQDLEVGSSQQAGHEEISTHRQSSSQPWSTAN